MFRMTMQERRAFEEHVSASPSPEFSNMRAWNTYILRCKESQTAQYITIALAWCRLVHKAVDAGLQPAQAIETTHRDVFAYFDIKGAAHPSYVSVLGILVECWVHGKVLEGWHRQKFGM